MSLSNPPVETRSAQLVVAPATGDGLTLRGLAVPFDKPTRINDRQLGQIDETIRRGAFSSVLKRSPLPLMLFNHGSDPAYGGLPVGQWQQVVETFRGLEVEGRLFDSPRTLPIRDAVQAGVLGLSIRFTVTPDGETWTRRSYGQADLRTINEVDSLREISVCTFPAYATEVAARNQSPAARDRQLRRLGILEPGHAVMDPRRRDWALKAAGII